MSPGNTHKAHDRDATAYRRWDRHVHWEPLISTAYDVVNHRRPPSGTANRPSTVWKRPVDVLSNSSTTSPSTRRRLPSASSPLRRDSRWHRYAVVSLQYMTLNWLKVVIIMTTRCCRWLGQLSLVYFVATTAQTGLIKVIIAKENSYRDPSESSYTQYCYMCHSQA